VLGCVGICWAVAIWVPFAIVMEFLKELDPSVDQPTSGPPSQSHATSSPQPRSAPNFPASSNERQPLLRRPSIDSEIGDIGGDAIAEPVPIAGGTVLGIHNLAIVFPQLIVAVVSSLIFRIVDGVPGPDLKNENNYLGKNGVAWVLRFGGFCTLAGAFIARKVPPTRTEKQMIQAIEDLRDSQERSGHP